MSEPIMLVRRAAIAAMIRAGGVPEPWQLERAGLPPLVRASDLDAPPADLDACRAAEVAGKIKRRGGPAF